MATEHLCKIRLVVEPAGERNLRKGFICINIKFWADAVDITPFDMDSLGFSKIEMRWVTGRA
jgi:hypothetical protein